jgi:hypothetical protein
VRSADDPSAAGTLSRKRELARGAVYGCQLTNKIPIFSLPVFFIRLNVGNPSQPFEKLRRGGQ